MPVPVSPLNGVSSLITSYIASSLKSILSFVTAIIVPKQGSTMAVRKCGIVGKGDDIKVMIL